MDESSSPESGHGAVAQEYLPGFQLLKRLGKVPNGEIFHAKDRSGSGAVLVKVIPRALQKSAAGATWDQLRAETGQLRNLYHERISNLLEIVDGDDAYVMAMSLPTGQSLRRHLKAHGRPGRSEAIRWARQLLVLLTEAHGAGVLHRNMGQDAVFIGDDRKAALCGFSLTSFSPTNTVVLSPEQRAAGAVDIRSDLYGVTQVFQECLMAASGTALEAALVPGDPLWAVIQRALAENPADRYSDSVALSAALGAAADWEPKRGRTAVLPTSPANSHPESKKPAVKAEPSAAATILAPVPEPVSTPAEGAVDLASPQLTVRPDSSNLPTRVGTEIETRAFNYPRTVIAPSTEAGGSWAAASGASSQGASSRGASSRGAGSQASEAPVEVPAPSVSSSSHFRGRSGLDAPPPSALTTSSRVAAKEPSRSSKGPWMLVLAAALVSLLVSGWVWSQRKSAPEVASTTSPAASSARVPATAAELRARESALAERAARIQAESGVLGNQDASGSEAAELAQPGMVKPGMVKPGMEKPPMVKPGMEKPPMVKPGMEKPPMVKPGMTKPAMAGGAGDVDGDQLAVREFLQSGVVSNLYRHANLPEQDRPLLEAVAADIASIQFAGDLHGDEQVTTVFGANPLLGENNPLLGQDLLEQWLVVGVRELGSEHALEHIRQQSEHTADGHMDRAGWYEHVAKCEVLCGMVVIGMLYEHIQQVAVSPHELLTFGLGSEAVSADGKQQLERLRSLMKQGDRMLLIGRASRSGDRSFNRELSRRRVEAVIADLEEAGVAKSHLSGFWLGYEPPQITAELAAHYRLPEDLGLDELNQSVLAVVVRGDEVTTAAGG